jgi:hypothetical protein
MVAIDNPGSEMADLMRRVRFLETQSGADGSGFGGGGDGSHAGSAADTTQVGDDADASGVGASAYGFHAEAAGVDSTGVGNFTNAEGDNSVAVGKSATALASSGTAVGHGAYAQNASATSLGAFANALHDDSTAIGTGADTTAADQIMLGTSGMTVVVPGTFSNPSARRLKRNIVPAPCLLSIFPTQYEWEYIADEKRRRHVGPIADELLGTDAERFLTFDDDGAVAGIDKLGLYGAQIAVLLARIESLEEELRGRHG